MSAADPSKRVLMPMGDSSDFLKKPEKNTGTGSSKSKTLRLTLDLFEPDEYKFPEFNYKKLVHIEKKKQKKFAKLPNGNHDDPLAAGDDGDMERIAKELEAKYGSGTSYGKASRLTNCDRGAGYDATDSFIDDTEAYDELIPDEIETDRGGFYINSGALEFKKLSNYERPGDEIRMPKAKKRALSTSSESSESEAAGEEKSTDKPKKKIHIEKKTKTTTSSSDEQGKAKKAKKEKLEKPKEVQPAKELVKEPEKKKPELEKIMKTTTVKDMLRAKRDNMRKIEQGKQTSSGATTATDDDDAGESESVSSLAVSESSRDSHQEAAPVNGVKEVLLPDNLPSEFASIIANIKQSAENAASTKTNFFDASIMEQLIKIDNGAKSVSQSVRIQTFNYLAQIVPCAKKTLLAKVRKYRVSQFESRVKSALGKLRKAVSDTMPLLIAKYDLEVKQYETKKNIQKVVGDTSFENIMPRKKFHWSDGSRSLLSELVDAFQELYKSAKSKSEKSDDFIARKLREEAVPLWPEGWIKPEDFRKELERKKKKEARTASSHESSQVQTHKSNTATINGKASEPAQKTETNAKKIEADVPTVNGKSSSQKSPLSASAAAAAVAAAAAAASVIKRSSDHSINSIISASPSPPTTSQSIKLSDNVKPRVIELEKLSSPTELLKVSQSKSSTPKFNSSSGVSIDITSPDKSVLDKIRRSDSSDSSDCVEIVGEFKPITSVHHHNNNNKVNSSLSHTVAPVAKKSKKHGSDDGEHETDYSKIIMGIQSLTDPKKTSQFLVKNPLASPVSQQQLQRKAETSHGNYDSNGASDHFLDPKLPLKLQGFGHNNNLHYSIGDLISNSNRDGNMVKGNIKSSPYHYNHQQQQLTSSTNNNLHSISLSLTSPPRQSPSHDGKVPSYMMPSILNLSNKK